MKFVKCFIHLFLWISLFQSINSLASEPLSATNSDAQKKEAGFVYGVAYSATSLASSIFSFCEKKNVKNIQDVKSAWETRNTKNLRAAMFMLSDSASSKTEEETAKEIIQIEANPTLEQYIQANLTNSDKPKTACKNQIGLIEKGMMDIDKDSRTKKFIDEYKSKIMENHAAISEKITDKKVYQALAATIALKKVFYANLNYCKEHLPDLDKNYENYRAQWETDNRYQLNAANLLIAVTYIAHNQNNNAEEANSFIDFIKDHSNKTEEKSTALLAQNKNTCAVIFNHYDQALNLNVIGTRGYENEVDYITQSYKTFLLNNLKVPNEITL